MKNSSAHVPKTLFDEYYTAANEAGTQRLKELLCTHQ
jgi:hypothetical protein